MNMQKAVVLINTVFDINHGLLDFYLKTCKKVGGCALVASSYPFSNNYESLSGSL